jgi:GT2 family glycosyltransferase
VSLSLSVIIPTYLGGEVLLTCLRALAEQQRLPDEVIVVVSNPEDTTVSDRGDWPYRIRVRRMSHRTHYGAAVNAGIGAAVGTDFVILNDDTRPLPGFLAVLAAARAEGGPAIYQPRILLMREPGKVDNTGHGLFFDGFNWARGREAPDG